MGRIRARVNKKGGSDLYVFRFTRDDRKFHSGALRDFMSLSFARSGIGGGPGGSLSKGFIAKSYTTVCPWILTWCAGVKCRRS